MGSIPSPGVPSDSCPQWHTGRPLGCPRPGLRPPPHLPSISAHPGGEHSSGGQVRNLTSASLSFVLHMPSVPKPRASISLPSLGPATSCLDCGRSSPPSSQLYSDFPRLSHTSSGLTFLKSSAERGIHGRLGADLASSPASPAASGLTSCPALVVKSHLQFPACPCSFSLPWGLPWAPPPRHQECQTRLSCCS